MTSENKGNSKGKKKQIPFGNDNQKGKSRSFALLRMTKADGEDE
jgi:hypothetical protein